MIDKIKVFFSDVSKEMKKVTWPKRDELKDSTVVVLAVSGCIAAFIFIADFLISKAIHAILG